MPDKDKLLNVIDAYSATAYGSSEQGGELSRQRALALDAYAGKNIEPQPKGRSQVVDHTVFETVQWILPSLIRIFASGDRIVEFEPLGPDDEETAEQESEYLNYLVTQKNNWFHVCYEWFQDALITKNAYCMVSMEEKLQPEKDRYESISEEQAALLLEDKDLEITGQKVFPDPDYEPQPMVGPDGQPVFDDLGQPVMQPPPMKIDLEVRRVKAKKRLRFDVLPPERSKVDGNCSSYDLEDCDYFEFWENCTISELRKMGLDVDDDIASDTEHLDTEEDASRDEILGAEHFRDGTDLPDPALRRVTLRTIWVRHDYDEDGISELQKVLVVGREVLDHKEASRIPVACVVPFINTHRHMGNSVADLVFDIQRIKTALLRGGLDSLYLANNPRHQISDKVNVDDLLVARPGAPVRLKDGAIPGEGHLLPLQTENIFPSAQEGLLHMDRVVEARVGVNRMFQGIDESSVNDHNRVGQLSSMAAQRVELIARLFGNGVERLFTLAHELVIKSGHESETVRLRGQWVDVDPSQWKTGRDMRVVAPYAAGNKDALLQRLMMVANLHEKALAGGLSIVQEDDAYELALEIAKAADLNGEKLFTDPATIPPREPGPDYTMLALEIEKQKADNDAADSERDNESDQFKAVLQAELDKYKVDINTELQIALAQLKQGQAIDLEQIRANIKNEPVKQGNLEIEQTRNSVSALSDVVARSMQAIKEVNEAITEIRADQDAPREIVRENGKIVGVKVNGKLRKIS